MVIIIIIIMKILDYFKYQICIFFVPLSPPNCLLLVKCSWCSFQFLPNMENNFTSLAAKKNVYFENTNKHDNNDNDDDQTIIIIQC